MRLILKAILAGLLATGILSILVLPCYRTPLHYKNPNKNTDYVWEPNSYWINMREGFSWGRFDENGYNNVKAVSEPDIVIVGSSHVQGTNIPQKSNLGYLLSEKLKGKYTVYNKGISGHNIYKISNYLSRNIAGDTSTSPKVVVMETSTVELDKANVARVIQKNVKYTESYTAGIIALFQRVPFFRLLHRQLDEGLLDLFIDKPKTNQNGRGKAFAFNSEPYETLFKYLEEQAKGSDTKIVIFYHPTDYSLNDDGTINMGDSAALTEFRKSAERHNIMFVDMTNDFKQLYWKEHKLPHGFANGKLGYGHLNADGHRVIGERLAEVISQMAEEGKICQ